MVHPEEQMLRREQAHFRPATKTHLPPCARAADSQTRTFSPNRGTLYQAVVFPGRLGST